VETAFVPLLGCLQMSAVAVVQIGSQARADATGRFISIGLVGLLHEQPRAGGPCPAKLRIFGKSRIERRYRISSIGAD
jgi:hypothetical protein